jgi:hypothetical protein
MAKPAQIAKPAPPPSDPSKKSLKQLFEERNRTVPGSKEDVKAAEKILEAVFPDSDANTD